MSVRHNVETSDGTVLCIKEYPVPFTKALNADLDSRPVVVLVHPYTIMGGSQSLMGGLALDLNKLGFPCITFDMRGAGESTGSASLTGAKEVDDVIHVCNWTIEKFHQKILLVGSSAGACIAGSAVDAVDGICSYVGIGYTFGLWASFLFGGHFKKILTSTKPKYFILGTNDGFTNKRTFLQKMASSQGRTTWDFVPGVGHFELESPAYDSFLANRITSFYLADPT